MGGGHQWNVEESSGGEFSSSPLAANFESEAANAVLNYSPKIDGGILSASLHHQRRLKTVKMWRRLPQRSNMNYLADARL